MSARSNRSAGTSGAAVGEIEAGGIALRQEPVADLEHRDAAIGVDVGEEFGGPRLALS